ncbi:ribonucleoside-triphosphate reductase, partial [Listeria monocytogenes]
YEKFIFKSRYAKWIEEEKRREDWDETVTRLVEYYDKRTNGMLSQLNMRETIFDAIFSLQVMPSMRAMMTAGAAMDRCDVAAYNCAY